MNTEKTLGGVVDNPNDLWCQREVSLENIRKIGMQQLVALISNNIWSSKRPGYQKASTPTIKTSRFRTIDNLLKSHKIPPNTAARRLKLAYFFSKFIKYEGCV